MFLSWSISAFPKRQKNLMYQHHVYLVSYGQQLFTEMKKLKIQYPACKYNILLIEFQKNLTEQPRFNVLGLI